LMQTARRGTLADLDGETAGGCRGAHPLVRVGHTQAFGVESGSSATHSSSSARSACQAATTTPIAAAAPRMIAMTEPTPGLFFFGAGATLRTNPLRFSLATSQAERAVPTTPPTIGTTLSSTTCLPSFTSRSTVGATRLL